VTFRVGQKVVCVDDEAHQKFTPFPARSDLEGLAEGEIYTVSYVGVRLGVKVVRILEIKRSWNSFIDEENFYAAARFRPVVERKTDITCFKEMLTPSPVTVDALNIADHARELVQ
jgi:hypothetical protein